MTYDPDYEPDNVSRVSVGKDYVHENAVQAISTSPQKAPAKKVEDAKAVNPNYGKVPHYL